MHHGIVITTTITVITYKTPYMTEMCSEIYHVIKNYNFNLEYFCSIIYQTMGIHKNVVVSLLIALPNLTL
jgi:hypothetical protein